MGFHKNFAQILQEKLGRSEPKIQKPPLTNRPMSTFTPPISLYHAGIFTWKPSKRPSSYLQKQRPKKVKLTTQPVEKNWGFHDLDKEGQVLLQKFVRMGAKINIDQFLGSQIKKEYRRLVRKFHPDGGGSPDHTHHFHRLQQTYKPLAKKFEL